MSNSARIWIIYALTFTVFPLSLGWVLLGLIAGEHWPAHANAFATVGAALWAVQAISVMVFMQRFARCWRCREPLFANRWGIYGPIVTRRYCGGCGVRHASRPEDVRNNPIGHFAARIMR